MISTSSQDLQDLKAHLLQGIRTVQPRANECIPGTRTTILANVASNTQTRDGPNIICILGAPGSGKSSISLTAKSLLRRQRQLVTYYRFDRNEATVTTPTALWRQVAYDLGRRLPAIRTQLLEQLREDEVDLDSSMDVFTSLIENPLLNDTSVVDSPLVIIIDALDECGGLAGQFSRDRQVLLQTLRRWAQLPKQFKLLVTSRPEGDITRVLSAISTPIDIPSGHFITENPQAQSSIDSSNDIRLFLEERFQATRQIFPLPVDWPGSRTISGMVHRAAGIFMWAITAANFIDFGIDPRGRLRKIMDDASDPSSMKPLYSLYAVVLEMGFGEIPSSGPEAEILQLVLGTMVLAKRPLGDTEYTKLPTTEPITDDMLGGIRDRLRSVIAAGRLRFVHKSFDDFLLSDECPPKYAIKKDQTHYLLTELCLTTMMKELRFNICGLETSCFKNADVPDIETKVTNRISPLLSYSCLFFADHLGLTPFDEYLMREVGEMMLDKLLFWFEAMSLLKEINRVSPSLLLILKWLHISPDDQFKDFLHDAYRFVGAFGHLIAQSTPHLYISALPFAPENSSVAKHFLSQFPGTLALSTGKPANWPSSIFVSEHHKGPVNCVAFSADEKHFVSGSYDKTIAIFDSETGNLISGPFECDDFVHSVCFDPNGRQVAVSCRDGKVICWDIETGDKHPAICTSHSYDSYDRFRCHFGGGQAITSAGKTIGLWNGQTGRLEQDCDWKDEAYGKYWLTSISPDGCYVALVIGQSGRTIGIWKVVNRSYIEGPVDSYPRFEHPGSITALSFSVDSKFAVSGSSSGTVLIWDVCTGNPVGRPLETGYGWMPAVAYSPKNHLLVSKDAQVMVWNPTTHELLGRLEGHTSQVRDITLSRDGQRALTASSDRTVRMWDLGRKGVLLAANASQTHTSEVSDVAFSPCGKNLASLDEHSIRSWDTDTGKSLFEGITENHYWKFIFFPNGSEVVTYCDGVARGSIGMWKVNSSAPIHKYLLSFDSRINHAVFRSTDGASVLCSDKGVVYIWSFGIAHSVDTHKLPKVVALSPDGLTAIVCDDQRSPRHYVWSTTTHQTLPLVFADDEYVSDFPRKYSPSGGFFASSNSSDQGGCTLRVWNMRTGGVSSCFSTNNRVHSLALSPDDRHIVVSYDTSSSRGHIWVFDACTGELTSGPWSGHADTISTIAYSPDGQTLASGSRDCQVRVWNIAHIPGDSKSSHSNLGVGIHMEDGWVKDVGGKLFFWVPKDNRARLVWPHSVPLGDSEMMTELDLSRFKYGESWTECYSGGDTVEEQTSGL